MKILSLFDGMSCGQLAIDRIGIKNYTYYASEIDKYAIQIARKNFPNTIHLGDVTSIKSANLPKIDLLIGGSPCQGFSFAGKQLAFDDPRSQLFFEFVRLLKELKPKYFLLENVRMKKEYLDIITKYLGVEPVLINSSLFSAQNRQRYYWTNIPFNKNIVDKGIILKDILETNPDEVVKMSDKFVNRQMKNVKGKCFIDETKHKASNLSAMEYVKNGRQGDYLACDYDGKPKQVGIAVDINGHDILKRVYSPEGKSPTITTMNDGNREPKVVCGRMIGRYKIDGKRQDHKGSIAGKSTQMLELRKDQKTNNLSTVQKDNVLTKNDLYWRKLTPKECERLQTVPDNYTEGVSNTQSYKMLGNGWTVDVIAHIFNNLTKEYK